MNEKNSNITDFQAMQEERADGLQEKQKPEEELQPAKQERKEQSRKYIINTAIVLVCMGIFGMVAFNAGRKSVRDEANAKVAQIERQLRKEYSDKKYALIEEQYEIFTLLKEGRTWRCLEKIQWNRKYLELGDDALDDLVLVDLTYISDFTKGVTDDKVLEYVETLKKVADKYPYSVDINHDIVYRLEKIETECREKIKKAETFEAMSDLKAQCEENIALWNVDIEW